MTVIEIAVLTCAALLLGVSKAGFGGGIGILVGPLLALFFPALDSVAWMLPLLLFCDLISLVAYWNQWDLRVVLHLLVGATLGIALGGLALGAVSSQLLGRLIGAFAIGFTLLQVARACLVGQSEAPYRPRPWHGWLVGLATGLVSTLSHVGGLLTTLYLLPQRLDNQRFVATTTLLYFCINLLKVPVYLNLGLFSSEYLIRDLPYFPVVLVGTIAGVLLNRAVTPVWFERIMRVFILASGIVLLVRD